MQTIGKRVRAGKFACLLLPVLSLLGACGTLVTTPFDATATKPGVALDGVPFSLNRPRLTVTRTEGADGAPDVFSLATTWEPDPRQQYQLKLDPGLFSSVDWTMTFDANGVLSDTSAKTTDQTASVISALGTLAAAAAAVGVLEFDGHETLPIACGDDYSVTAAVVGKVREDVAKHLRDNRLIWNPATSAWVAIMPADVQATVDASNKFWNKRVQPASCMGQLAKFHYRNWFELQLLHTAMRIYGPPDTSRLDAVIENPKSPSPLRDVAFRTRKALVEFDLAALDTLKSSLIKARSNLLATGLNRYGLDLTQEAAESTAALLLLNDAMLHGFAPKQLLLAKIALVKQGPWLSRELALLNDDIARIVGNDRIPPSGVSVGNPIRDVEHSDASLQEIYRTKAYVLGLLPDYDRRRALDESLAKGTNPTQARIVMAEIDFLDRRLTTAESAVLAPKPASKADDPVRAPYLVSKCVMNAPDVQTAIGKVSDQPIVPSLMPEYVVVFNPVKAPPCTKEASP
jgi:hypothetical protein